MKITYQDLNIVYEDNHILVVVKPHNVPSQGDKSGDVDMLTLLKQYLKEKYHKEGNVFLGLVHRLDRPTGGVMVFAKTSKAAARLKTAIDNGDFEKRYLTVVNGVVEKEGVLDNYLLKYEALNIVKVVPPATKDAKRAVLKYWVFDHKQAKVDGVIRDYSLIWIKLFTGRTHQIRVQFANIGHSLVGDVKYGESKSALPFPLALWACELRFPHPVSGETLVFRVYPDLKQFPFSVFDVDPYLRLTARKD